MLGKLKNNKRLSLIFYVSVAMLFSVGDGSGDGKQDETPPLSKDIDSKEATYITTSNKKNVSEATSTTPGIEKIQVNDLPIYVILLL